MKTKNVFFIITFIAAILIISIYILFIKDKPEISQLEQRKLSQVEEFTINNWFEESYQKSLENTLADHFILREQWLKSKIKLDMILDSTVNSIATLLSNKTKKRASIQKIYNGIALINDLKYLIRTPYIYDESVKNSISISIDKINYLSNKYKNVEFYVYIPTMPNDTDLFNVESSGGFYQSLFSKLNVPFKKLEINDIYDIKRLYFRTDHHWNHVGAYKGYVDIANLLFNGRVKPNIPVSEKHFNDVDFFGSSSREIAYSVEMEGDKITKYIFKLPKYKLYIDGKNVSEYGNLSKYLNGEIDRTKGFDHYNFLYQVRRGEIAFDFNRKDLENILIISDSMSNPIRDVIASHFNKSIFINLDYYYNDIGEFNIEEYLNDHQINKVLFMDALQNYFPEGEMRLLNLPDMKKENN